MVVGRSETPQGKKKVLGDRNNEECFVHPCSPRSTRDGLEATNGHERLSRMFLQQRSSSTNRCWCDMGNGMTREAETNIVGSGIMSFAATWRRIDDDHHSMRRSKLFLYGHMIMAYITAMRS